MGWKSTVSISRSRALELIQQRLSTATNRQLGDAVEFLGYGDDPDLEYYGHNFNVCDRSEDEERAEYERLKLKYDL